MGARDELHRLLQDVDIERREPRQHAPGDSLDEEMPAEVDAAARRAMAQRHKIAAALAREDGGIRESVLAKATEAAVSYGGTFWARLQEAERVELAGMATAREFAARQVLFHAGDTASGAFVVVDGWVRIIAPSSADGVTVALRGAGDLVGEGGALCAIPRSATVQALGGDLRALEIPGELFSAFLAANPLAARLVEQIIWRRLHDADDLKTIIATASPERRLASVLGKLAEWHRGLHSPPPPDGLSAGTPVSLPLSVMDLASMSALPLGTVESVTRRWKTLGILQAGATGITLLRLSALDEVRADPSDDKVLSGGHNRERRAVRAWEKFRQFQANVLEELERIPQGSAPGSSPG
jgi:CRP-like cAMP-binding protein